MYNDLKAAEKKKKGLMTSIKDAHKNYKEFDDIKDEMDKLKVRKKEIDSAVRNEYSSEYNDLDDVKTDIKDTKMMLSDLMWNEIMKNNTVEVVDQYDQKYVPEVNVTLRKDG